MSIAILGIFLNRKDIAMFNGVEYIRNICKERGIPISSLEKKCGFANGYLNPKKLNKLPYDRALLIADILNISVDYLMTGEEKEEVPIYYTNEETAAVAKKLFEEDKVLFEVYRSSDKDRLVEYAKKLKALRDMEEGGV